MVQWKKYYSDINTRHDIYRSGSQSVPKQNTHFCNRFQIEFITDTTLNIGEFIYIDHRDYPTVEKRTGDRVMAFKDTSRGGYCYDVEISKNKILTMFVPENTVRIIDQDQLI